VFFALLGTALTVQAQSGFRSGELSRSFTETGRVTVSTETVSLVVSVTDREGRCRAGLGPEDFVVYDNGVRQEISFFSDHDAPASVAVVFDVSGSITQEKPLRARDALRRFIETSHGEDEYFLVAFNSTATLLDNGTQDAEGLLRSVSSLKPNGETALYDTVSFGLEKLSLARHPKRALIVISDGEDNHSRSTFGQLRRRLQEAAVTIYSVGTEPHPLPRSQGRSILSELASASGGRAWFPVHSEEMSEAFEEIALELRHQYSIGYLPSNFFPDGSRHHIRVRLAPELQPERLKVRARDGYQAAPRFTSTAHAGGDPRRHQPQ